MKIVHISDIHFGEELVKGKVEKAVRQINEIEPDLVIVTGDLTCWGIHAEFRSAYDALSNIKSDIIVIPGNHDARNSGDVFFELYFGKSKKYFSTDSFVIVAANSTQPDRDEGYIGHDQREWIEKKFKKKKINILALHHHIVPIPYTGRERNVLIDAGEIVETLVRKGVALVLSGHRHMPYSIKLMRTHIIHAGTLGSFKVLAMPDNNYNIIDINEEYISLKLRFVDLGEVEIGRYKIKPEAPESIEIYHRIQKPKRILFLSKKNELRTHIAEAIFNKLAPKNMLAISAGLEPSERVNPLAIKLLKELGITAENRKTRKILKDEMRIYDYIISFDPDIEADEYWKVDTPKNMQECRLVKDCIYKKIEELISRIVRGMLK